MCCFSNARELERVSGTRIFARFTRPNRQVLAYSMTVAARSDLAMILPLPVPPRSFEDAVRFISLEGYPTLFSDLSAGFPQPQYRGGALGLPKARSPLKVHRVGAFEASFVPTLDDFSRLDPRFTIDRAVWDGLPGYADYGFAVFKLRAAPGLLDRVLGRPAAQDIHPMAFSFPTRHPDRLFLPTLHIHDGEAHGEADFDHTLYCQVEDRTRLADWDSSGTPAGAFVDIDRAAGLVDGARVCFQRSLSGKRENTDTWVARWAESG
jgi:hypothetical protein